MDNKNERTVQSKERALEVVYKKSAIIRMQEKTSMIISDHGRFFQVWQGWKINFQFLQENKKLYRINNCP